MPLFSALTKNDDELSESLGDLTNDLVKAGEDIFDAAGMPKIPVEIDENESEKTIRAELPLLSGNSVQLNSDEEKVTIGIEKLDAVNGTEIGVDGIKDSIEDFLKFHEDTDLSSLNAEWDEGILQVGVEKNHEGEIEDGNFD